MLISGLNSQSDADYKPLCVILSLYCHTDPPKLLWEAPRIVRTPFPPSQPKRLLHSEFSSSLSWQSCSHCDQKEKATVLLKEWCDGSFLKSTEETQTLLLWCHLNQTEFYGLIPTGSHQDVAYSTNTLAAWEMALLASLDTFTPSGSCWGNKRCGGVLSQSCRTPAACYQKTQAGWGKRFSYSETNNIWT